VKGKRVVHGGGKRWADLHQAWKFKGVIGDWQPFKKRKK